MQKTIIVLFVLFFSSCGTLHDAKGKYNEIILVSSNQDKKLSFKYIEKLFSESVHTPSEEFLYTINWIKPSHFKDYLEYRNLFFISISEPKDSTIDLLVDNFKDYYKEDIFILNDVYARNQTLIFLSSQDSLDMVNDFLVHQKWILNNFDYNISKGMESYIYRNGRNKELEKKLDKYYEIESKIQKDYMIIKDQYTDKKFVWIGRGYPYRWVTFNKLDRISELNIWYDFKESISKNMPNVKITDNYKNMLYESDDIIKIQGLYEEEYSNSGGPFITYVKFDNERKETFIVSGFVNNPGKSKIRLLKELEIQIKNIIKEDKNEK